jgi:2,4-dienoyl-CoA reductase-like NADH-dependent reductase (Old Yellow Enzyme family)
MNTNQPKLFEPLTIRNTTFKNRIFISPMCMYSAEEGVPNNWHLVHLGSFAKGGAALVMAEATAVVPEGRISPGDTGLWNEEQRQKFSEITAFIKSQGSVPAIQLAHAGRKASTAIPWAGHGALSKAEGGWNVVGPSAIAFSDHYKMPTELSQADLRNLLTSYEKSANLAVAAGFEVIEVHAAHGYLLHEFLSPLSNKRADDYGGSFEARIKFPLEVVSTVRRAIPEDMPLFVRISATDWVDGGWTIEDSVAFSRELAKVGVDLVDCSTGGNVAKAKIPVAPGYQVPFADAVRNQADIRTGAVGLITEPEQAESILQEGKADVVFIAREALRNPHWALQTAQKLNANIEWPRQYERAKPSLI